ncbi:glutathione S-transferase family protein [Roseibium sp.]|uniref:glutathione S-transferase family protein n=1 Tax=Roseibium sp. TaxID=1936156 RepID=UPI003A97B101
MSDMELVIGNKNYSSWSLRPWLAMTHAGIPFAETVIPFDFENGNPEIRKVSPSGKVPLLKDGDLVIWETLAILEYVAERFPDAGLWPKEAPARARARSVSAEMASGFSALRAACPMNMRRKPSCYGIDEAAQADVERVIELWHDCLSRSGGPFLFGEFTIADAMYAPVVSRFETYELTDDPDALAYMARIIALPAWKSWREAGERESWVVAASEI